MVRQLFHRARTHVRAAVSVFMPPVLLLRKLARPGASPRAGVRTHAFTGSGPTQVLAAAGKVAAVAAAGVAVGPATGTLQLPPHPGPGAGAPLRHPGPARAPRGGSAASR